MPLSDKKTTNESDKLIIFHRRLAANYKDHPVAQDECTEFQACWQQIRQPWRPTEKNL
jgi:hypothetical protein